MRALIAITLQTIRAAFREKVVLCLLVILALVLAVLPNQLQGDGTGVGKLQLLLRYALGLSLTLQAFASIWMACSSLSSDISSKRIHLVLTKSISRGQLLCGKWLGLMAVQALFCAVVGFSVSYQADRIRKQHQGDANVNREITSRILTARSQSQPELPDARPLAEERLLQEKALGKAPTEITEAEYLQELERYIRIMQLSVPAHGEKQWTLTLPRALVEGETAHLQARFSGTAFLPKPHEAEWIVGTEQQPELLTLPIKANHGNHIVQAFEVPAELAGKQRIHLTVRNQADDSNMIYLNDETGISLLLPHSGFGGNTLRVMLCAFSLLGVLTAIGLGAGAMFSMPVAVYLTSCILMLYAATNTIQDTLSSEQYLQSAPTTLIGKAVDRIGQTMLQGMHKAMTPVRDGIPLNDLSNGVLVPWRTAGSRFLTGLLPSLLVIGLITLAGFRRRELGDAS